MRGVYLLFFIVSQINNNNYYTLCYSAKYGKNLDICKQREKFFLLHLGFAIASQTTSPQDNKTTSGCRTTSCLVDSLSCSLA